MSSRNTNTYLYPASTSCTLNRALCCGQWRPCPLFNRAVRRLEMHPFETLLKRIIIKVFKSISIIHISKNQTFTVSKKINIIYSCNPYGFLFYSIHLINTANKFVNHLLYLLSKVIKRGGWKCSFNKLMLNTNWPYFNWCY